MAHKEEGNIRIWSTRKDRNLELVHKEGQRTFEADPQNIEFDPQGEGRTSESGPQKEDWTLNIGPLGRIIHLELVNEKIA